MTTIDTTVDTPDLNAAASLAATAAASVPGVHALGSLIGRASDAVRERVGLASTAPGVKIDTDRADSVSATISLVVDYPHKLREVSEAVRTAVRSALEPLGRGTIDVNVIVTGVFGPFDRDVVDEAEEKADAVAARASEAVDDVKARSKDLAAQASAAAEDVKAKSRDVAASASETVDAAVAKTKDVAAGAAAAVDETVKAARERVAATNADADIAAADRVTDGLEPSRPAANAIEDDRGDVSDVVAEALEDAAIDIAIAADEVRADDTTPATDSVQSVVEDDRPRP
ncbi:MULTISPECIES: Asp23/Gls24 family envelope stress response protein [Microbacterium]|uniref:Asp23/Gls24 family envelope stress response protein n=1 Tax=Microbacterium TaxID=33882 RepID=UPI002782F6B1|nr:MULTISPECIES: Asp23/Gls24 family envelope stress response protein [Microbacterium]MDQ1082428.1 putative alkaline shock family protein YloU [Microbacterium sp. SORGH_AS_0344]MDQ1168801.1 putative alkaline shock family protein YloU [Microbacterium proteolyticum]